MGRSLPLSFLRELGSPQSTDIPNQNKTPDNGYLGSRNDEERSEMRYAVRIAEFSESSEL